MATRDMRTPPFDLIRCDDPRLQVAYPTVAASGPQTLAQLVLNTDPDTVHVLRTAAVPLHAWAQRTAAATLDDLVEALLAAWERLRPTDSIYPSRPSGRFQKGLAPPLRPAVRHAVARRLGLLGEPPAPLTACLPGTGISRSRLRQLTLQIEEAATGWIWAPALDRALQLGAEPVEREQYATTLRQQGLARRPWHPEAVNALARLCRRTQRVVVRPELHLPRLLETAKQVIDRGHLGVASTAEVAAVVAEHQRRPVTAQMVTTALAPGRGGLTTDGAWVWWGSGRKAQMLRVARGMLAVAGSLPVTTIHHGWCRRLRRSGVDVQPPIEALDAALRADQDFVVHDQPTTDDAPATVRLARPMLPEQVYGPAALVLMRTIRAAPGQAVTRRELDRAATEAGFTATSVSHYLKYGEAFTRYGPNLWTLVGR